MIKSANNLMGPDIATGETLFIGRSVSCRVVAVVRVLGRGCHEEKDDDECDRPRGRNPTECHGGIREWKCKRLNFAAFAESEERV